MWGQQGWPLALRLAGLLLCGVGLATCFAGLHECSHRTAFRSRTANDVAAWWLGLLSFYNATAYRRYHQWHHRYTHQPGLDPELDDPVPTSLGPTCWRSAAGTGGAASSPALPACSGAISPSSPISILR